MGRPTRLLFKVAQAHPRLLRPPQSPAPTWVGTAQRLFGLRLPDLPAQPDLRALPDLQDLQDLQVLPALPALLARLGQQEVPGRQVLLAQQAPPGLPQAHLLAVLFGKTRKQSVPTTP